MSLPVTDRRIISGGPGVILYKSAVLYSAEPFTLNTGIKTFPVPSDAYGLLDTRVDDDEFSATLKLVGEWRYLDELYPYFTMQVGSLIFGDDVPLDILSLTDDVITRFHSAAITKMPDITFAPTETLLQETTFRFVRKNLTERSAANSLYTQYRLRDGTFTLTYGTASASLPFNATAAQVSTALNALAAITADGGVTVSGTYKNGFTITWVSNGARATALTGTPTGFPSVGTATTIAVAVSQAGGASAKEVRTAKLQPWTGYYGSISIPAIITQPYELRWISGGTFTLTYGADTTTTLGYNATAAEVEAALNALASITSAGGVTVAGDLNDNWEVTFVSTGARTDISGAVTSTPPGTSVSQRITTTGATGVAQIAQIKLSPWASFGAQGGAKLTFAEQFEDRVTDVDGVSNIRFMGLEATVELVPDGITDEQILAAGFFQGAGAERGRSLNLGSHNLDIVNTGVFARIYGANISEQSLRYAVNEDRVGTIKFMATRVINSGVVSPMAFIGTAAP